MRTRQEVIDFCLSLDDTYKDYPFHDVNWTIMRHKGNQKMFAAIYEHLGNIWVNVMKKALCIISILLCILLSGCGDATSIGIIGGADGPTSIIVAEKGEKEMYEQITAEEAKKIMDSGEEHIILDTREQDEFDEGHIPNAILIPYTEIEEKSEEILPDKVKLILVYCRSGRRSKIAAESLAKLGYTNVKEFGGIIDWSYEVEK